MDLLTQNYMKVIKISVGGCIAFILAELFQLDYAISAGVITLLTIQDTKKETLVVALKRFVSFFVAMLLATIVFSLFGYTPIIFGLFLFLFCLSCFMFGLQDGLASSAVITTHIYLLEEVNTQIMLNELYLMIIGVGIGVILNSFMPNNINKIKENQKRIETSMKQILSKLSELIVEPSLNIDISKSLTNLDELLIVTQRQSIENSNNTLLSDTTYYVSYVQMRQNQMHYLKHIHHQISSLHVSIKQAYEIANFIEVISSSFHEYNDGKNSLLMFETLRKNFENESLPTSRIEFEHRALLFAILHDLEAFLMIKKQFIEQLSEDQIRRFQPA